MQARQAQEGDTLCGKPQADWANSCPRSPAMNVGSTANHTKKELTSKTKKPKLLDKPLTGLLGRASDAVPSDDRTSARDNNKNNHFVSNQK